MAKRKTVVPDINQAIAAKLQGYPPAVSELAARAVQLAGSLTADDVAETLEALVREMARSEGTAEQ